MITVKLQDKLFAHEPSFCHSNNQTKIKISRAPVKEGDIVVYTNQNCLHPDKKAKNEYTKQLQNILRPHLYEGLVAVYNKGKSDTKNVKSSVFKNFQDNLSLIPQWNQDIIETEAMRIRRESKCDWLDDLITAIFVSNVRILTAIKNIKSKQEIKIKVPNYSHFVHS